MQLSVTTRASALPWESVLAPGRGVVYDVLAQEAPELGRRLHAEGMGRFGLAPFGHGAPVWPSARRRRGQYAAKGSGVLEFGSPVPEVVAALEQGLAARELLDWGGVALRVTGLKVVSPPDFASGTACLRTSTPVVVKGPRPSGEGAGTVRQKWVLPTEGSWPVYFQRNLARKAETLGLEPVALKSVTWVGAKRSFCVGQGSKPGAPVEVVLAGPPETLQALWSWGLGLANSAGFGWVKAA